ncbi:MAG: pilus assembly protein PilP [Nitrospira sp.]
MKIRVWRKKWMRPVSIGVVVLVVGGVALPGESRSLPHMRQVASMRPADSLKVLPLPEAQKSVPVVESTAPPVGNSISQPGDSLSLEFSGASYDPSGRRDPFLPMFQLGQQVEPDSSLPPLQRVGLTELSLIGVLWGNYGYTAMVQTPDGKGYSIRRGTRIGPNNGVVSSITERGIIVQERFTDVYGNKQEREYVKLLHPKEGTE